MTVTRPGDSVSYDFVIANRGTINAKIGEGAQDFIKQEKPTCNSEISEDATLVCNNLTYTLKYKGGTRDGQNVSANDTLNAGQTETVTLKLAYDGDNLPSNDVTLDDMGITIVYRQVNN